MTMTQSEQVRVYCIQHYVESARVRDVHRALGFKNRLPLVCSSLGATKFEETARVRRIAIEGPMNGASTTFRFEVLP